MLPRSVSVYWIAGGMAGLLLLAMVVRFVDPGVGAWACTVRHTAWSIAIRRVGALLGGPLPHLVAAGALLLAAAVVGSRRLRRYAGLVMLVFVCTALSCHILKIAVSRPRPVMLVKAWPQNETILGHWNNGQFHSFPSGDVAVAAGLAMVGVLLMGRGRARWLWFLLPAYCAVARVVGARHYPSDCLAAATLGVALAWLLWRWRKPDRSVTKMPFDPSMPGLGPGTAAPQP